MPYLMMAFTDAQCQAMLALARQSLLEACAQPPTTPVCPDWLQAPGACFVTLTEHRSGALRGCIGSLEPYRALGADLIDNARQAAFADPRFEPVRARELPALDIAVAILTPAEPLAVASEAALLAALAPGRDGVIVEYGDRRATYLPSVWEQLPEAPAFTAALRRKAGLAPQFWDPELRWYRYQTQGAKGRLVVYP